jgi:hypothetical protein
MQLVSSAVRVGVHPLGRDVTDRVQANISQPEFNAASHQLSVQVSVTNLSREPMVAPLCLELLSADSGSEVLHAFNAQNSLGDAGAIWLLNPSHDADRLDPSLASAPTTLVFESKIAPTKSAATNVSADFGMMFHIFDGCRK